MLNWTMLKEFLDNASNPEQGDAVVRINVLTKHDGSKKYSIESGSVGGDFPIRISRYVPPAALNASIRLLSDARDELELQLARDLGEIEERGRAMEQARKELEAKKRAKQQKREANLAARKAENQARARAAGGGKKKG